MAKNAQTRPGNLTGKLKEDLAAQNAEEVALRSKEMSMMTAEAEEAKKEPVDYTGTQEVKEVEVEQQPVEVKPKVKRIRVNDEIQQMTFGTGTSYDFETGRYYDVPADLADHLDELGYVYH